MLPQFEFLFDQSYPVLHFCEHSHNLFDHVVGQLLEFWWL